MYEKYKIACIELNEGLILTHDMYDSINIINRFLSKKDTSILNIDIVYTKINIAIITDHINITDFYELITLITNLGYFIADIALFKNLKFDDKNKLIFKWNEFIDYEKYLNSYKVFELCLEPKFDNKIDIIDGIFYHVTEKRYVDKILKNGLIPKSKNSKTSHPERIYLSSDIQYSLEYIQTKKSYYRTSNGSAKIGKHIVQNLKEVEFVILEIDLTGYKIVCYNDPNYIDKGIYTYDNISPKRIKIANI